MHKVVCPTVIPAIPCERRESQETEEEASNNNREDNTFHTNIMSTSNHSQHRQHFLTQLI